MVSTANNGISVRSFLITSVERLPGVGPKRFEQLQRLGLATVEDLLFTLPQRYEDRRQLQPLNALQPGSSLMAAGEINYARERQSAKGRRLYEVLLQDASGGSLYLKWFRYQRQWFANSIQPGGWLLVYGDVRSFGHSLEMHHPEFQPFAHCPQPEELRQLDPLRFGQILPVYPLTQGLSQLQARKLWRLVVDRFCHLLASPLPEELRQQRQLWPLGEALRQLHFPAPDSDIACLQEGRHPARRSLAYDELFFCELGLALKRRHIQHQPGYAFTVQHRFTKPLAQMLPFALTQAQRRVLGEIKQDMMAAVPMQRLVQGDVGSGKTVVALMAALLAIENNTQVALVAPTEVLAEQHYLQFHYWLSRLGLNCGLLVGSQGEKERQQVLPGLADGSIHMVVGTHAVLQENTVFACLGLGIIDEQHRFGVAQRGLLQNKGTQPHMLIMTATPIPRTLSLTLYGELDISVIDSLPPGRQPITTRVVGPEKRQAAFDFLLQQLQNGRQAYMVLPLVEDSEVLDLTSASAAFQELQERFPEVRMGLLHGRMNATEKEQTMSAFRQGQLQLLVATTVIEVGVDVPNATLMVIDHAERYGLAQLHQLRGRVGRGSDKSYCLLLAGDRLSREGRQRLQVMAQHQDGFKIAEADLQIRGPGEFLGTRQSGLPAFQVANLLQDLDLLETARQDAYHYSQSLNWHEDSLAQELWAELQHRWGGRLRLAQVG